VLRLLKVIKYLDQNDLVKKNKNKLHLLKKFNLISKFKKNYLYKKNFFYIKKKHLIKKINYYKNYTHSSVKYKKLRKNLIRNKLLNKYTKFQK